MLWDRLPSGPQEIFQLLERAAVPSVTLHSSHYSISHSSKAGVGVAGRTAYTPSKGQQNGHANEAVGNPNLLRPLILQKFKL